MLDDLTPGLQAIRDHERAIEMTTSAPGGDAEDLGPLMWPTTRPAPGPTAITGPSGIMVEVPDPADPRPPTRLAPTDRTTLRRKKERGSYDRDVVNAILDEGLLCHVGFSVDGSTFVIPMAYARIGDTLYLHGATGNRMLRHLADGSRGLCHRDLARRAGPGPLGLPSLDELPLRHALRHRHPRSSTTTRSSGPSMALLEHIAPGRSADARPPSAEELRAVLMVRVPIAEGSAKVRTGGPIDEPERHG